MATRDWSRVRDLFEALVDLEWRPTVLTRLNLGYRHDFAQADGVVVLGAEHTARVVDSNRMPDLNQVYSGEAIPQFAERVITMMAALEDP